MVSYFVYATDVSGSTCNDEYYHSNGLEAVNQFRNDVEKIKKEEMIAGEPVTESKIIYLHWAQDTRQVTEEDIENAYIRKRCDYGGGTIPETIVEWLRDNCITGEKDKIKLLYIITDGYISESSVARCFELNEPMYYETVVFHAFNSRSDQIDLSVAASFFKKNCLVYRNNELCDCVNISEEFDYANINIDNFKKELDQLKSYIKLKFIGNPTHDARALQEITRLKQLRNRLFNELSLKTIKNEKRKINLETKDKNTFLREFVKTDWYKNLSGAVYEEREEIEKRISVLINYIVSEKKSYSFDALNFNKKFVQSVEEEHLVDDCQFSTEQEIEFPDIILDDDKGIPVVILTKHNLLKKIIFHETQGSNQVEPASFNKFKSMMDCPLYLIDDQEVSESIGYFYTLNVYKQFLANNTDKEPRTRKQFYGGLVLTDSNHFDKYNDYIISATYFDFQKVHYNIGLFYFVLWKNCENKEWMDRNVVEQFKKYTMRRISEMVCKIGLSSLPLDPTEKTSLLTALWYCVELSSCLFKDDHENFYHERLRMYYKVAPYMVEILKYFDYDIDLDSVEKRSELFEYVTILKKMPKRIDKVHYLLERIFKTDEGFLVSEIENPLNLYKLNYLKLNHKSVLSEDIVKEKVNLEDYLHVMHYVGDLESSKAGVRTYELCEKTFRPYFVIDENKSYYTDLKNITKKVTITNDDNDNIEVKHEAIDSLELDKILSLYKLFIDFVVNIGKYPTLSEYTDYVLKRRKFNDNLVTIFPSNVHYDIKKVFKHYEEVVGKVAVEDFIKASKRYLKRNNRIVAEEKLKFQSDDEISNFISNEELKVKLIKKTSSM